MANESISAELVAEENSELFSDSGEKIHPWRICPLRKHLVRAHDLHIPPNKKHSDGIAVIRTSTLCN